MTVYPEHEKMSAVQKEIDALREFLDAFADRKQFALCKLVDSGKRVAFSEVVMEYQPVFRTDDLVYEFFEIDQGLIEMERREMLEDIRS